MIGKVHILVNCPIDTFLKEKQHSALSPSPWLRSPSSRSPWYIQVTKLKITKVKVATWLRGGNKVATRWLRYG